MDDFIHRQNLIRFIDLLEQETDGASRATLRKLLVEEEDRFGTVSQRLDEADMHIAAGQARIARQNALVGELRAAGRDTTAAETLLGHFAEVLGLFQTHRNFLQARLDESGV